jgi:hypothetical protein
MVYDVVTQRLDQIPSLQGRRDSITMPQDQQCGIHSVQINPSKTLLATGARNSSEIAVYRLPTLDPVCVGEVSITRAKGPELNKGISFHFMVLVSVLQSLIACYILFFHLIFTIDDFLITGKLSAKVTIMFVKRNGCTRH